LQKTIISILGSSVASIIFVRYGVRLNRKGPDSAERPDKYRYFSDHSETVNFCGGIHAIRSGSLHMFSAN
ncbi:MAG: hypothetical protein ACXACY_24925, partial [Candidatus Hodarchaeales archaeon]